MGYRPPAPETIAAEAGSALPASTAKAWFTVDFGLNGGVRSPNPSYPIRSLNQVVLDLDKGWGEDPFDYATRMKGLVWKRGPI